MWLGQLVVLAISEAGKTANFQLVCSWVAPQEEEEEGGEDVVTLVQPNRAAFDDSCQGLQSKSARGGDMRGWVGIASCSVRKLWWLRDLTS